LPSHETEIILWYVFIDIFLVSFSRSHLFIYLFTLIIRGLSLFLEAAIEVDQLVAQCETSGMLVPEYLFSCLRLGLQIYIASMYILRAEIELGNVAPRFFFSPILCNF
jgi:hypothetical protein